MTNLLLLAILIVNIFTMFYFVYTFSIKNKKKTPGFVFDQSILDAYNKWIVKSIQTYMVKYIEEVTGTNLIKDDEISITSEFAIDGISYVNKNIIENIPDFFQQYAIRLYGEDKFISSIYELVRQVFTSYISTERNKRLHGGSIIPTKKE